MRQEQPDWARLRSRISGRTADRNPKMDGRSVDDGHKEEKTRMDEGERKGEGRERDDEIKEGRSEDRGEERIIEM